MSNNNIDWDGNCVFDENGKVVSFLRESPNNSFGMKPIPKGLELTRDAKEADRLLASVMQPATVDQIGIAINKLSLHCGMQAKAPEDVKHLFLDYCHDLKDYPRALIDEACEIYRKMPEGNNFLPGSGKLISLMRSKYNKMLTMRKKIDQLLGKHNPVPARGNKSISLMDAINNLEL